MSNVEWRPLADGEYVIREAGPSLNQHGWKVIIDGQTIQNMGLPNDIFLEPYGEVDIPEKWALCEQLPAPQAIPLDTPDGPGWWAFEGTNPFRRQVQIAVHFKAWEICTDEQGKKLVSYDAEGELYPTRIYMDNFRDRFIGKWWRLQMPWDTAGKEVASE